MSAVQTASANGCQIKVRDTSIALYEFAAAHAAERGIIIADTKFEFGLTPEGELLLMDEALTPDSSRFWPASSYRGNEPAVLRQAARARLPRDTGLEQEGSRPALPGEL